MGFGGWRKIPRFRPYKQYARYNIKRFKDVYMNRMRTPLPEFKVPQELIDRGVPIEYVKHDGFLKPTIDTIPKLITHEPTLAERIMSEAKLHQNYNENECFMFTAEQPFSDGIAQALQLTKSVKREGLPEIIKQTINNVTYPDGKQPNTVDHVELLRRIVMRSQKWDGTLELLPPHKDKDRFWRDGHRIMGISDNRKNTLFVEGLYYYASTLCDQLPQLKDLTHQRHLNINRHFHRDSRLHGINVTSPLIVTSHSPLPPLLTPGEISDTINEALSDVHPIDPVIDLTKTNIYKPPTPVLAAGHHMHTILTFRTQDFFYPWAKEHNIANAIMHAFAAALEQARTTYGESVTDLPVPIVTQCIHKCGDTLDLVVFQLNTLALDHANGVRNVVWLDTDNRMYEEVSMWEEFPGLDNHFEPNVFDKLLSMWSFTAKK